MKSEYDHLVFPVLIGKTNNGQLSNVTKVGRCVLDRGKEFYRLRVFLHSRCNYFIAKSSYNDHTFKVYSKVFLNNGKPHYLEQVGTGLLQDYLRGYMKITLNLIPFALYMDLCPCNVN